MEAEDRRKGNRDEDVEEDEEVNSSDEEGIDLMNSEGDSSEEEEEDPEEEAKIREGFIVDEDEDSRERRRRKKKKRKHRERDFEALSDDDLDLVEQNTGVRIERPEGKRVKKLKRAGAAEEESEDEDNDGVPDIANIFDDIAARREGKGKRRAADDADLMARANRVVDMDEEDDMADFIEEDSPDEDAETRDRDAVRARKQAQKERRRKRGGFAMGGMDISNEAWDEIQEVFGDGHDYDDALDLDEDEEKPAPTIQDVFEPSEIAERMMTAADDIIRALDIPERMQIAQAGIQPKKVTNAEGEEEIVDSLLDEDQLQAAAFWAAPRISEKLKEEYLQPRRDGSDPPLKTAFYTAVARVLHFLCIDYYEVPFIWVHRRDYFVHHDPTAFNASERSKQLLNQDDLWKLYSLAIKYRALQDRKAHLAKLWEKLQVEDVYYDELFQTIDSPEEVADLVDYVTLKYQKRLKELAHQAGAEIIPDDAQADAVRNGPGGTKYKRANSNSRYEKAKDSTPVRQFAGRIAMSADDLAQDFINGQKHHFKDDPHLGPDQYATEYIDAETGFVDSQSVLLGAKVILVHEIAKEPSIRKEIRKAFESFGVVTVKPTDKGNLKIDEMHPYFAFKYLLDKPLDAFKNSAQFLQIMAAENEGLVEADIHIQKSSLNKLTHEFYAVYLSDLSSDDARAWNKIREEIIRESLQDHLLPLGARWARDWLKESAEDYVANKCAHKLEERIDMAPYLAKGKKKGEAPRVLAMSNGQGNFKKDFVYAVCLNQRGRLIDHERFEDIQFGDTKERLKEHIERLRPEVIVVGGFSPATKILKEQISYVLEHMVQIKPASVRDNEDRDQPTTALSGASSIEVIYVHDHVARSYQHSKRAMSEFAEITPVARYCIGLARYAQSPICEYAGLGSELSALSFDPDQKLVPRDRLQNALERTIVNAVNLVGVDINKAIRDAYYRVLLPFVAGLGPRKANGLIKRMNAATGGTVMTRSELVQKEACTTRIWMNCVAFLKIPSEEFDEDEEYDILDSTRIHYEDYHIARKMAADAEELDEEDLEDGHPSAPVVQLMEGNPHKLDELSLDDFAAALYETQHVQKRLTLYMIRDELQEPFSERRSDFASPTPTEVFTMLTGETRQTLSNGFVIPVVITKVFPRGGLQCRLDSGLEGKVEPHFMEPNVQYQVGQTVQGQVISIHFDTLLVELSILAESLTSDAEKRRVQPDVYYDTIQMSMDRQAIELKNKKAQGRTRRVVNHPNFQNMNAGQAEQYLANQQRGDCVVRPSSKGNDHLAVTWKVDEGVYQHLDVLELDKPNEFSLGRSLRIHGKYTYSDLDELIVSHVRAMARKVDEMMHSDKYKGSEADLRKWLQTSIMAEPTRSFYGFALDVRKPGNFILSFLTKGYEIQSWGVTVEPEAFVLQGNSDPAPNVVMLCNAFKSTYVTKMALAGGNAAGLAARTPYLGGRTPNPYAGNMTPYGANAKSPYAGGRYPPQNPMQQAAGPSASGNMTPYGAGAKSPYGGRTPQQPSTQPAPTGAYIHPSRLQQQQYGQGGRR